MTTDVLADLSPEEKLELLELLQLRDRRRRENSLAHYKPYEKQKEFHNASGEFRERLFMAANQGHPLHFKVLTPTGWRAIGDLVVGDEVIAGDGTATMVTATVDLGEKDIYEVSFDAGDIKVLCTDDHLWAVRSPQRDSYAVQTTLEVAARKMKPRTPGCAPVQFPDKDLPLDPYLLGLLIGDGSFTNLNVQISSNDQFILDEVRKRIPESCLLVQYEGSHFSDWRITTKQQGQGRRNAVKDHLDALGLLGKRSEDKSVPELYMLAGVEQRTELLRGLMDSDGSNSVARGRSARSIFYSSSLQLAEDVRDLCRSLGGKAFIRSRGKETYKHPKTGEIRPCLPSYYVEVRLPKDRPAFKLPRKTTQSQRPRRARTFDHFWEGIELKGREQARCISIAHPSRLYICQGFIVTHNCGKTLAGAHEVAMHATGRYPDWWKGRKFPRAVRAMVGSESAELTRKGVQRLLLGPPEKREEWGTGAIPKDCLTGWSMKQGVSDAVASVTIKNEYGGESVIQFSSYEQGRAKWQADTIDLAWMDEEPPEDVYFEALTRTNATQGMVMVTFTPLMGMSRVVKRFLTEKPEGTVITRMTIDDVEHYSPEERARIVATYPEHERDARTRGIPIMGSGMVFPVAESVLKVEPFEIPPHWARINGIDFGVEHPSAFVCVAHDRETDTAYVYDAWKVTGKKAEIVGMSPIALMASMVQSKGYQHIPISWPHDGLQREKSSGEQLRHQYSKFNLNMLAERAQFEMTADGKPGGNSVEAGISMMLTRMQTRRLRVFSHLNDVFDEMRLYHRKDGLVVKIDDDIISAMRYALMMLRKAKSLAELGPAVQSRSASPILLPAFEVFDQAAGY